MKPTSTGSTDLETPTPTPPPTSPAIVERCKALIAHPAFDTVILGVILVNAVVLGLDTYGDLRDRYADLFTVLFWVILGIYVAELLIRISAVRWNPRAFAEDKWNVFDFIVVGASFVPYMREYAMLLRLLRLLRIVRIIRFLPELRVVVAAIGCSMRGVASLVGATILLIYVYAMVGCAIFGVQDSAHFGNVGQGMLTMFIMLTFSNLTSSIEMGQKVSDWTVLYFISYTVIVAFLIFNLFVGIVLNAMGEARKADRKEHEKDDLLARMRAAREALEDAEAELQKTHRNDL